MADRPVFLYAAVYDEIADAEADYEAVFDLHAAGAIGTFDSGVIRRKQTLPLRRIPPAASPLTFASDEFRKRRR